MIKINNLTKSFGKVKAVNNISLSFDNGVIGLVGENGAGKSTLFRLISGIIKADSGSILINDKDSFSKEAKEKLFFLSDDPFVPYGNYLKDLYEFYSCFYNVDKTKFNSLITRFDLPKDKKISSYSKGMKRKAFIALTLAIDVDIYLLDEAFDGIDPLVLEVIKQEIIALGKQNKTVIISSHNISTLERLVDRTIILYAGQVKRDGNIEHLGDELVKYQIYTKDIINEEVLIKLGIKVVSLKKVGSIYHLVIKSSNDVETIVKEKLNPILFEKIPIDGDEIVILEMMMAKLEGNKHE
ncbi:MAG: ABC transporter ATP-binding protein [Bacilli bacterium]